MKIKLCGVIKMLRKTNLLITLAMALFLTACAGTSKKDQVVENSGANSGNGSGSGSGSDSGLGSGAFDPSNAWGTGYTQEQLSALGITRNPLEYDTVFFEFNSSQITERSQIIVTAHAKDLAGQSGKNVVLEGHTDERGTREYNLALGERRAVAVQNLMTSVGAGSNSISPVTYGEERPIQAGQSADAWSANRRVQILK